MSCSQVILEIMWWSWTPDTSPSLEINGNRKCIRLTQGKQSSLLPHSSSTEDSEHAFYNLSFMPCSCLCFLCADKAKNQKEIWDQNHMIYNTHGACNRNNMLLSKMFRMWLLGLIWKTKDLLFHPTATLVHSNSSQQPKCTKKTQQLWVSFSKFGFCTGQFSVTNSILQWFLQ